MEPLRQEWAGVQATAERLKEEKKAKEATAAVKMFHDKLCATRVLDPACGTGNFLFVALELMKRLEGEVLEALVDLGGQEALRGLESHNVDPHQFLGLEKNPRAAAIAELVIWLGYLQWHYRTKGGDPLEPILRDFKNVTAMDAVLTWDGYPVPGVELKDGKRVDTYPNAHRPDWPDAEFIVGNPPFIGAKH
jgi:SAM-dependent methyltransferase